MGEYERHVKERVDAGFVAFKLHAWGDGKEDAKLCRKLRKWTGEDATLMFDGSACVDGFASPATGSNHRCKTVTSTVATRNVFHQLEEIVVPNEPSAPRNPISWHCHVALRRACAVYALRIFESPRRHRAMRLSPRRVARG